MFTLRLDNINLFSVLRYLEKSRLSQKLLGFINHATAMAEGPEGDAGSTAPKEEKPEFQSKREHDIVSQSFSFFLRFDSWISQKNNNLNCCHVETCIWIYRCIIHDSRGNIS